MKNLLVCCVSLVLAGGSALAQTSTPAASTGWARVEAQPAGSTVQVKAVSQSATCVLQQVTADSLTCTKGVKQMTFARGEIRRVRVPHRAVSAVAGLGIGAGAGAGIGAAATPGWKGLGALVLGVPLAVIGAGVGAATDFTHSTLYSMK